MLHLSFHDVNRQAEDVSGVTDSVYPRCNPSLDTVFDVDSLAKRISFVVSVVTFVQDLSFIRL